MILSPYKVLVKLKKKVYNRVERSSLGLVKTISRESFDFAESIYKVSLVRPYNVIYIFTASPIRTIYRQDECWINYIGRFDT